MYYTHLMHELSHKLGLSYIQVSTHAYLGSTCVAHYRDQTTESTCSIGADVQCRCRCPKSSPIQKPPMLELELVLVKRLTARPWRPTCPVGDKTSVEQDALMSPNPRGKLEDLAARSVCCLVVWNLLIHSLRWSKFIWIFNLLKIWVF